ncbi:MAG: bifunctional metallophosphatase/5'-nucleotidase [Elusimicrobiaceae bacterium]|nr:bifunctional metallophosphatase/5'-nucleotidase [Elusimicrobiaceae bacterium]
MKKLVLLLTALLLPFALSAKDTVVYHTSDTHGFYYPQKGQGGFAALAAVLKKGPKNYLLLDSGDFANGTIEAKNSKGLKSVEIMNALKYDAATIGNHEFDFTDAAVPAILDKAQFAILAANFVEADTLKYPAPVEPYKIFTRNGVKIAVIGLANNHPTQDTQRYAFTKPLEALETALTQVEKQNPDAVVVLVHDSVADDKHGQKGSYVAEIAEKFAGRVNVVLGGHAHKIIQNKKINGVLFAESGCYTKNVSKVTITTDNKTGKFVSAKSEIIPLYINKTGQDASILKLTERLREPGVDEVLGYTEEPMPKRAGNPKFLDNSLDNWVADLGRAYAGVDVFVTNTGGTRVDMPQGAVTKRDVINIHPFENTITRMTVDGRMLKRIVKSGLSKGKTRFAYSGLAVSFVYNKKGKVKDLRIWVNTKPLENHKNYTIATNSFIAQGRSEGAVFKSIPDNKKEQVGTKTIRQLIEEGLGKGTRKEPLKPGPEGRVAVR